MPIMSIGWKSWSRSSAITWSGSRISSRNSPPRKTGKARCSTTRCCYIRRRSWRGRAEISVVAVFFNKKTAYEIKECDWSSAVCSSDLMGRFADFVAKLAATQDGEGTLLDNSMLLHPQKVVAGKSGDLGGRRILQQKDGIRDKGM